MRHILEYFILASALCGRIPAETEATPFGPAARRLARSSMHEVGIIQNALQMAIQQAQASGASRVHQMQLRIGALSGVVPEALQFAFEVVTRETMAAGARLEIETVPATCWCAVCQAEFECPEFLYECPRCHQLSSELRRGLELELSSVEIS